jgi:hypothetical protein
VQDVRTELKLFDAMSAVCVKYHKFWLGNSSTAVFVLLLAIFPSMILAQTAQEFPQNLLNTSFLETRTWKRDSALELITAAWPKFEGKQGFEDKTVVKATEVRLLDTIFQAEYRVFKKEPVAEIIFLGDDFSEGFCSQSLEWLGGYYGKPRKTIDLSTTNFLTVESEWLFGETRIKLQCVGARLDDKFVPGVTVLVYRHKDWMAELKDIVYINCSGSRKFVGNFTDGKIEQDSQFSLIIDPNGHQVLRRNKEPLGKVTKYTEEEITVAWEMKDNSQVLVLDRLAGTYRRQFRLKKDTRTGIDAWGECSKITSEQKF